MQAAFPSVTFNIINLARAASEVIVASTCWYQYVPQVRCLLSFKAAWSPVMLEVSASTEPCTAAYDCNDSVCRWLMLIAPRAQLPDVKHLVILVTAFTDLGDATKTVQTRALLKCSMQ